MGKQEKEIKDDSGLATTVVNTEVKPEPEPETEADVAECCNPEPLPALADNGQNNDICRKRKSEKSTKNTGKIESSEVRLLEAGMWKPHSQSFYKNKPKIMDFISKCLVLNPNERWSAAELCTHPFIWDTIKKLEQ